MNPRSIFLLLAGLFMINQAVGSQEPAGKDSARAENPPAAVKTEQPRKPNYFIPVIAGAVGGILLALWLRRRKG